MTMSPKIQAPRPTRSSILLLILTGAIAAASFSGCASKGYVRKEVRGEMTALEERLGNTERATTRAGDDARTAHERALDAAYQAQVAKDIALGNVRREEIRNLTVNFAFDSAELSPESEMLLDGVASDLKANANYMALVSGYTDATGGDEYNRRLAERRASSVHRYLAAQLGHDFVRLATVGFGEILPVADNDSPSGRQQNRRAEISIVKPMPLSEAESQTSPKPAKGKAEKPVF